MSRTPSNTAKPTFRDPDGYCWVENGRVFRRVFAEAADRVRTFHASPLRLKLEAGGLLPVTWELSDKEALQLGLPALATQEGFYLEHAAISMPSFAHEWSPTMLFAAGLLTLDIQKEALKHGYTLKDAAPSNILFSAAKPMFVDYLSFQPIAAGEYLWMAEAQFVRNFVLPILLNQETGEAPHAAFLSRRDGYQPEDIYGRLGWLARLKPGTFRFVTLPVWLSGRGAARDNQIRTRTLEPEKAAFVRGALLDSLRKAYGKFAPAATDSNWSNYMAEHNYAGEAFADKERFVEGALIELAPGTLLDVGCNTGHFSRLAATKGCAVVALDYDAASVDLVFAQAQKTGASILPLVINLARPSPAVGWRNSEQAGFLERAHGKFDAALLLAVIHHLTATDGIPLEQVFSLLAQLVRKGAVVEYVAVNDSMMQGLLRNKEHLREKLTQQEFEQAFAPWFTEVRRKPRADGLRCLYLLARRPNT